MIISQFNIKICQYQYLFIFSCIVTNKNILIIPIMLVERRTCSR